MLNLKKKSFQKNLSKDFFIFEKNLSYNLPALKNNFYIQLSNLSKKFFIDVPIIFIKKVLKKKYRTLNFKFISTYIVEQMYYSSSVGVRQKFSSRKSKNKFSFFYLNFDAKNKIYLYRFVSIFTKIFSSFVFSGFHFLKNYYSKKILERFSNFFYFINFLNNNLYFISFFIFLFNKFLIFTCLGFKMYTFKKYKKFINSYLTLNLLNVNKFHIFKVNQLMFKKIFRFNFYFKFV